MRVRCFVLLPLSFLLSAAPAVGQPPKGEPKPLLRLEAGGPTSNVTGLAFSPDGKFLYAAGLDKVVRVWAFKPQTRTFVFQDDIYYRVPIAPGEYGAINTLALSEDGSLLAVGGFNATESSLRFDELGAVVPSAALTEKDREDIGLIYIFDTKQRKLWKTLRGHAGEVRSLAFLDRGAGQPPTLVSAARVRDPKSRERTHEVFVWSPAAKAPLLARLSGLPAPDGFPPPALAAWLTGANQLRVAIALTDGKLRVWDVAKGNGAVAVAKAPFNSALAVLPGGGERLVGGTIGEVGGVWDALLRTWRVNGGVPQDAGSTVVGLAAGNRVGWVKGLSLFAVKPAEALDHAAIVLSDNSKNPAYSLEVRGPGAGGAFTDRKVQVPLWSGTKIWPAIATSRRGDHIAVAGSPDHRILVFPVAALLAGNAPRQEIHSAGVPFQSARFATRGEGKGREVGLILEAAPKQAGGAPGILTFNFTKTTVADGKADWMPDELDRRPWTSQVFPPQDGKQRVVVWNGEQQAGTITLSASWQVRGRSIIPPGKLAKVPLVAIALFDPTTTESLIDVYNVATSDLVLRLTGHQAPIRSLSVARDARLLASTADDQTVCVWSLTDLLKALGEAGGEPGLWWRLARAERG